MKLIVDVHYSGSYAIAAGLVCINWDDVEAKKEYISGIEGVSDYEPGQFYKRELPPILKLIAEHQLEPECILIDGYVFLDGYATPGLGKHLYDALDKLVPVIGVAKSQYRGIDSKYEVYRGRSRKPLYVTAAGMDVIQAKRIVESMHGEDRIPTLIKYVDQLCRCSGDP